mmetsp:Transcript_21754/g.63308  ORF Transcript_21754/g.63308 Transcript_21754/m.63308 type:complete len:88 (-) Transcript_21754:1414-1677(-)
MHVKEELLNRFIAGQKARDLVPGSSHCIQVMQRRLGAPAKALSIWRRRCQHLVPNSNGFDHLASASLRMILSFKIYRSLTRDGGIKS